ncbi:MAG: toprim domain-containing protein [Betaproteobacteria bacterium]|nr:toprim domain-containing protein [Betaproteobacteria bacterium]
MKEDIEQDIELRAMRELPPGAAAGVLGLRPDAAARRQHGGEGFSYWRTPEGALITVKDAGRGGFPVWHLTKRGEGAGAGGDWISLAQFIQPGATIGHVRKMLRPALGVGRTASLRASQPLLAPKAATTVIEPPKPLELSEPPPWAVAYLLRERGIPISIINHAARLCVMAGHQPGYQPDPSAVHLAFPHAGREGIISHAELRGPEGSGDGGAGRSKKASRGRKGLWILPAQEETRTMLVTEGAIKGLALHAKLAQASKHAWIVSTGGDPGQAQLQQLAWLAEELGIETVALAQDNDAAGDQQARKCAAVLPAPIKTKRFTPPSGFVGWDDWAAAQRG